MACKDQKIRTATIHKERDGTKWYIEEIMDSTPDDGWRRILKLFSKDRGESEEYHGIIMKTDIYPNKKEVPKLDMGQARAKAMREEIGNE